jgi:hypothetical protein
LEVSAVSTGRTERPNVSVARTERKQHKPKKPVSDPRRFRNDCCSARDLCPAHRIIAVKYRAKRRAAMERRGLRPYAFEDERANELIALAHDLHGPTLPETPRVREQVFVIANYLTGEPHRFKAWLAEAVPWYDEDDADELLERLNRKRYRFRSAKLAELFAVTWERKKRLGIKTIAAPDTPAEVIEAAKERQRERDKKCRRDQRRRQGKPTRAQYLADVKSKEPWVADGISRRTWYRRRKLETKMALGASSVYYSCTGLELPSAKVSLTKPWVTDRISRATWYRRHAQRAEPRRYVGGSEVGRRCQSQVT